MLPRSTHLFSHWLTTLGPRTHLVAGGFCFSWSSSARIRDTSLLCRVLWIRSKNYIKNYRTKQSCGWDLAECGWDLAKLWMRSSQVWMGSSQMVRPSGCQCQSRNSPMFDPSILRHSGTWGTAEEAVLNNVKKKKKNPSFKVADLYSYYADPIPASGIQNWSRKRVEQSANCAKICTKINQIL